MRNIVGGLHPGQDGDAEAADWLLTAGLPDWPVGAVQVLQTPDPVPRQGASLTTRQPITRCHLPHCPCTSAAPQVRRRGER